MDSVLGKNARLALLGSLCHTSSSLDVSWKMHSTGGSMFSFLFMLLLSDMRRAVETVTDIFPSSRT